MSSKKIFITFGIIFVALLIIGIFIISYPRIKKSLGYDKTTNKSEPDISDFDCTKLKQNNLGSDKGEMCNGQSNKLAQNVQLCYKVGYDDSNKDGWYASIGDMNCSSPVCMNSKKSCSEKPSCKNLGEKCSLSKIKNL
jgi:hypothetical protein